MLNDETLTSRMRESLISTTPSEALVLDLQDLEEDGDDLGPKIAKIKEF